MNLGVKGDLKQEIFNEVNENVRALERLFPSAVKDGQVDFQALKEELGQFEEVGPEKYELTWSGKQNAKKIAQEDIVGKTLKYIPEDSKNPETTKNLYIEGDNLEVLKLLRQNYYGAIKMIYIDPPYNTGNDFVYNDNFKKSKYESDREEGDISELGERYTINSKSSNKYHANWLNMMYLRLRVSKDLLKNDGVIFISIDENEIDNLKKICSEIFGEDNFAGEIVVKNSSKNDQAYISIQHEYIICYVKSKSFNRGNWREEKEGIDEIFKAFNRFKKECNDDWNKIHEKAMIWYRGFPESSPIYSNKHYSWMDENGVYFPSDLSGPNFGQYRYDILHPLTGKRCKQPASGWRFPKETMDKRIGENLIHFGKDESTIPNNKTYLIDTLYQSLTSVKYRDGRIASKNLNNLMGGRFFNNPKDIEILISIIRAVTDTEDIILDFFSGSSTTAHAIMKLNAGNRENRRFIMVQLPEKTDIKSEAYKAGYKNICEIGKERIRRAGEKIKKENKDKEGIEDLDIGFKVFRVGDTNIRWNYEKEDLKTLSNEVTIRSSEEQTTFDFIAATNNQVNLDETVSAKDRLDFMPGFKDIDIVYEILLRQRDIPLSAKVELLEDIGKRTYIFADSYLVCLEEDITVELIEKLAELNPLPIKFILRDSAFGDDIALKDEAYRRLKALIERNSGESKKTYTVEFI